MNLVFVSYLAGLCSMISFVPQVYKTWKSKKTKDISIHMYLILATASILWITYGVSRKDGAIILTNVIIFLLVLPILFLKLKHG